MPRLFTGIELPPEIRTRLSLLSAPLTGAKWVEAENLHLTLRFLGRIPVKHVLRYTILRGSQSNAAVCFDIVTNKQVQTI